ncbi:unnamed protein product [Merluccius merluccius]
MKPELESGPRLGSSRGCSQHIKGSIRNVQNKWRDVKPPKDHPTPTPATTTTTTTTTTTILSSSHKSLDPCARHRMQS